MTNYNWTGDEIKRARTLRGLSQRALADALAVSVTAVSQWETGRSNPTWSHRKHLTQVLLSETEVAQLDQVISQAEQISRLRSDVDRLEGLLRSLTATLHTKFGEELADLPLADDG